MYKKQFSFHVFCSRAWNCFVFSIISDSKYEQREGRDLWKSACHHWKICRKRLAITWSCISGTQIASLSFLIDVWCMYWPFTYHIYQETGCSMIKIMIYNFMKMICLIENEVFLANYTLWCPWILIHNKHTPFWCRKFLKKLGKVLEVLGRFVGCCPCLILLGMIVLRPSAEH